jgi:hypothetical protein
MRFIIILLLLIVINLSRSGSIVYSGTICGWAEPNTTKPILCNGFDPRHACPSDYLQQIFKDGWTCCFRTNTTARSQTSLSGTICGGMRRTLCGGLNPHVNCPEGYALSYRFICYKSNPKIDDASGTCCGLMNQGVDQTCNGLPIGTCPSGFYAISDDEGQWHTCFKHA